MKEILLVEEDISARMSLCNLLGKNGYKIVSLSSPRKALDLLYIYKPDLVISGNKFHNDMEGIEFGDEVKNLGIPFILTSGMLETVDRAKNKGIVAFNKPYDIKILLQAIRCTIQ